MAFWNQRRVLVTGGAGFCGAHLCALLCQRGAEVTVLDRSIPEHSYLNLARLQESLQLIAGDILDAAGLKLLLARFPFDVVFHAAAQPIVSISNALPAETAQVNIAGTYNVLEAIRVARPEARLVFASSGAYYGATQGMHAIAEDAPPQIAANIYAPSKVAADLAVRCYARIFGLRAATCRWMNTYGPGDTNFSRIVPATIRRLVRGEKALVDGTDGTNILEVLHVRDMAQAYLAVAEQLDRDDVTGEAFNFGGGAPLTLRELVVAITRAWNAETGEHLDEEPTITGPHVHSVKYLDIRKAKERLGWEPRMSLDQGLRETIAWYRAHSHVCGLA